KLLGEILVAEHGVSAEEVTRAVSEQLSGKKLRLSTIMLERNVVTSEQLARALASQSGLRYHDASGIAKAIAKDDALPLAFFLEHRIVALPSETPPSPEPAPGIDPSASETAQVGTPVFLLDDPSDYETLESIRLRF